MPQNFESNVIFHGSVQKKISRKCVNKGITSLAQTYDLISEHKVLTNDSIHKMLKLN